VIEMTEQEFTKIMLESGRTEQWVADYLKKIRQVITAIDGTEENYLACLKTKADAALMFPSPEVYKIY
jgi:hypothetical protein